METTRVSKVLIHGAMAAIVLAVVHHLSPGVSYWMSRANLEAHRQDPPMPPIGDEGLSYSIHSFTGGDGKTKLTGKLYLPEDHSLGSPPPVIVMAHGLGCVQDAKLDAFIHAFGNGGMAAFTLDYATFGWSQGWPRHQVHPQQHIQDLKAALSYIQNEVPPDLIDGTRIGLWGTSLGGGHVLSLAADDSIYLERPKSAGSAHPRRSHVKAVVAQVPHIKSGLEGVLGTIQRDPWSASLGLIKILFGLIKGGLSYITTGDTIYLPLVGPPGSAAIMQNPGDEEGYLRVVEHVWTKSSTWQNYASVSSVLAILTYRPLNVVDRIGVPTLFVSASEDTLCPAADTELAAAKLREAHPQQSVEVLRLKGAGHFDIYDEGRLLTQILGDTVLFFQRRM